MKMNGIHPLGITTVSLSKAPSWMYLPQELELVWSFGRSSLTLSPAHGKAHFSP